MAGLSEGFPSSTAPGAGSYVQVQQPLSGGRTPQTVNTLVSDLGANAFGPIGTATATGTGGTATATVTGKAGKITTGSITGVAAQVITVTATGLISASPIILFSIELGTGTTRATVTSFAPTAPSTFTLTLAANDNTTNLNGTYVVSYVIIG